MTPTLASTVRSLRTLGVRARDFRAMPGRALTRRPLSQGESIRARHHQRAVPRADDSAFTGNGDLSDPHAQRPGHAEVSAPRGDRRAGIPEGSAGLDTKTSRSDGVRPQGPRSRGLRTWPSSRCRTGPNA